MTSINNIFAKNCKYMSIFNIQKRKTMSKRDQELW